MNILGPVDREVEEISTEFIDRLVKRADGDSKVLLQLVSVALRASEEHQDRLKAIRLEKAKHLRDAGVPMTEIAEAAGVNDSYISRLLIQAGSQRRVDRTRNRRVRRNPPPGRTP